MRKAVALTIAGSDPSGGAGIQADLKTFHQFGVYGEAVITLLTVQNTVTVEAVRLVEDRFVVQQLEAVLRDVPPMAAKTGALGDTGIIEAVAGAAEHFRFPLVVDPVMISKHGAPLIAEEARGALAKRLMPRAFLVTPNLHEAATLAGMAVEDLEGMKEAARRLRGMGARAVLVKGGHLAGTAVDLLYTADGVFYEYEAERIETGHTHGTGCTYSAAITACLARGVGLVEAVGAAKRYITEAIRTNPGLGNGSGPVNHHAGVGGMATDEWDERG
ncbi:MAG: bifunctional hydroxymethylpyrimidine kinase/phosphomethylpyrimidine kinase [Bryobacterales bacterium]|nr:bifunctional hydroxymethylpyrimidine kinase/phosphomethylpyrimidine kinase [Bryobacterales bacterium]